MLKLHNMYKIYQTDEIETVALNGVNLEIEQAFTSYIHTGNMSDITDVWSKS